MKFDLRITTESSRKDEMMEMSIVSKLWSKRVGIDIETEYSDLVETDEVEFRFYTKDSISDEKLKEIADMGGGNLYSGSVDLSDLMKSI